MLVELAGGCEGPVAVLVELAGGCEGPVAVLVWLAGSRGDRMRCRPGLREVAGTGCGIGRANGRPQVAKPLWLVSRGASTRGVQASSG